MKKVLFLCTAIILSSCNLSKRKNAAQEKKEIVIVGAGVSGLSAARYLKENGYTPIILEAQANVGGRTKTNRDLRIAFDEGASWIHGPIGNPITELAKVAGAKTYITNDDNIKYYDIDGSQYSTAIVDEMEEKYLRVLKRLTNRKKSSKNKDESFAHAFYQTHPQYKDDRLWTFMLSAFLEFDTGGDIHKLSSVDFYDDDAFDGEDVIITNGYDHIPNYLAQNLDIRLNTKVLAIDYTGSKIKIETNNGNYSADAILVTVPLGVLKKKVITFTPPLPESTQTAIDKTEMGSVNKFLLKWKQPFWDTSLQYIGYTSGTKGKFDYFMNVKKFANANALMTFTFGDYSKKTEQMSDDEVIQAIMSNLKKIYGDTIPNPSGFLRTKWNENPYSYGSYSFATKGIGSKAFKIFEHPINNKVFFAGEHTIIDYRGTVHGAYLSGIREAKKIMKSK